MRISGPVFYFYLFKLQCRDISRLLPALSLNGFLASSYVCSTVAMINYHCCISKRQRPALVRYYIPSQKIFAWMQYIFNLGWSTIFWEARFVRRWSCMQIFFNETGSFTVDWPFCVNFKQRTEFFFRSNGTVSRENFLCSVESLVESFGGIVSLYKPL